VSTLIWGRTKNSFGHLNFVATLRENGFDGYPRQDWKGINTAEGSVVMCIHILAQHGIDHECVVPFIGSV
jgi:hypothetical protein